MLICDWCQDEIKSESDNFGTRGGREAESEDLCKECYEALKK